MTDGKVPDWPAIDGAMAARIRALDWTATPLGPAERWSGSLRVTVELMLAAAAQIVLFWGPDFVALYNDAYAPTIGAKHPRALGRPAVESWSELWDDLGPLLRGVRETGETFAAKDRPFYLERHGRGETVYFDISYSAVREADGSVGGVLCIVSETTARVLAERRQAFLLGLSDTLRSLVDPAAIQVTASRVLGAHLGADRVIYAEDQGDGDTMLVTHNAVRDVPSIAGLHRHRDFGPALAGEMRAGRTVVRPDIAGDPSLTAAEKAAHAALQIGATLHVPLLKADRLVAFLAVHHRAAHVFSPEEQILVEETAERTWAAVERARAEAALRELNEKLEARVAERSAELARAQEALVQSQKMEAVGQLTGGLAHDFNNLLTGVMGSLELIQARIAQGRIGELGRYADAARGAAERAAALTHRLLAFSRRQTLDPRPTDANRLVAGMEELIRRTVGPSITVEVIPADGLWATMVDPHQLESALLNLCINARDAMPGGGRLIIETANRCLDEEAVRAQGVTAGHCVSLCVRDTGTGMSPEVAARAFEPFFTTKPMGMGTGLGLSMVYGFVRQSGGQVYILSEPGAGAAVCLTLPRHLGEAEAEVVRDAGTAPRAEEGETVLVVDDEPVIRMLIVEVLEELGYAAVVAADGASGLEVLASGRRLDLLVTDVGLPGSLNGRQLADAARSVRPELKVLFITGYAEIAVLGHDQLEPGMTVMTKPFGMEQLAARIKEITTGG